MQSFPFQSLLHWSKIHGRDELPWRQYFHLSIKDLGYHIWLSEILLQQTQVDRVIRYYNNILKHFPTIESLANASYDEFFPHYQGLGYYSRARNMLATAKIVVNKHEGVFPNNREFLIALPGVGPYTAAAIQAFVYDEKILSFDTNLEKIFSRYYYGTRFQKLTPHEKIQIEKNFQASGISGRAINAAFMDLGSFGDTREGYPLKECKWYATGGALEIQEKKKRMVFPTKDASIIVVLHENHRIYYSSKKGEYQSFLLPPTEEDIRHFVQEYFRTHYNLELSVRPVHKKYFENDAPFMICNAQVQKGKVGFQSYRKENGIFVENR